MIESLKALASSYGVEYVLLILVAVFAVAVILMPFAVLSINKKSKQQAADLKAIRELLEKQNKE